MTVSASNLANLAAAAKAPEGIMAAIQNAAQKTGVDFDYLVTKAQTESSFNPNAKASTSSATGLYQFTDKTWLQMVRDHGDECGLGQYSDAINGNCHVSDAETRKVILDLRKDPGISAYMAAAFTKVNQERLEAKTDFTVGKTELYLAHFLGAGGATQFLKAYQKNPDAAAADILPNQANANENVFYDKSGNALSLKEIYNHFAEKFDDGAVVNTATKQTLPAAPVLAQQSLDQTTRLHAPAATLDIALPHSMIRSIAQLTPPAQSNTHAIDWSALSAAVGANSDTTIAAAPKAGPVFSADALSTLQQQTQQQTLGYLTQVALDALAQSSFPKDSKTRA